jgi:hypothetical protein
MLLLICKDEVYISRVRRLLSQREAVCVYIFIRPYMAVAGSEKSVELEGWGCYTEQSKQWL